MEGVGLVPRQLLVPVLVALLAVAGFLALRFVFRLQRLLFRIGCAVLLVLLVLVVGYVLWIR